MQTPSETELVLLRILWRHKQLSAREIHEASVEKTGWSYSATRKTLDRMVAKNLLTVEPVHGIKTFVTQHSKLSVMAGLISNFAKNVLDTDQPLPAAALISSRHIDEQDIAELEQLLEELDQAQKDQ